MKAPVALFNMQCKILKAVQTSNQAFTTEAAELIKSQAPLCALDRLAIYQDAYFIRMLDTLALDFVRLKTHIDQSPKDEDQDNFANLVKEFISEMTSTYTSIAEVGQNLPLFLKKHIQKYGEECFTLASLDWLELLSFYTEDQDAESTLTADRLANGVPFTLQLKASTFFFASTEADTENTSTKNENQTKKYYVSSRNDRNEIFVNEIAEQDFLCLQDLKEPKSLEQFHALLEKSKIDLAEAQGKIANWFAKGLLRCVQHV